MTYPHTETRRCISIPCGHEVSIEVTSDSGTAPPGEVIDRILHELGWREGFCPKHTGLGPEQTS